MGPTGFAAGEAWPFSAGRSAEGAEQSGVFQGHIGQGDRGHIEGISVLRAVGCGADMFIPIDPVTT